jgi:hypothetical protein
MIRTFNSENRIKLRVRDIYLAFNEACKATMKTVGAAPGFNLRWWNDECKEVAKAMREGFWTDNEQRVANKHLKSVVREAKKHWADEYITTANVWEVAAWRHGRRSSHIPALRNHNNELAFEHEELASLLSEWFFAEEGNPIPPQFHDDPAPRAARPFVPFDEEELGVLLKQTANKSAPGTSGIGWFLLKRGWDAVKDHLLAVYNACFHLGHHPARWREAKVVVIPKPDKPDYSLPKAHRPISLLETMSKLLEKAVAVTDLQGPPSERTQMEKIRDLKSLARQYTRDRGSCDDTRISYLEYVESEAEADWTLAWMIAG